ncbi:MAG: TerB family tellurite resistance protein [Myxococcota bacterium]
MPEPTYENITPLVAREEVSGNSVRITFRCPVSNEEFVGTSTASETSEGEIKKEIKRSFWRNVRWSISSMVRSMFGYGVGGVVGGAVVDTALTPSAVRDMKLTSEQLKQATIDAFRSVSTRFAWDQTNGRWVSARTLKDLQSEFAAIIGNANISQAWDRSALARMLAEIAAADGALSDEERELFHSFVGGNGVPSLDELLERPPLSAADLEECSHEVRNEMWLIAAAMAVTDQELAPAEKALLDQWGAALGMPPADQKRGLEIAREWVVDQALEGAYADGKLDKSEYANVRALAARLGVANERVDRLDARCRKRRGIF